MAGIQTKYLSNTSPERYRNNNNPVGKTVWVIVFFIFF
jgi:hypothetical protein